MAQSPKLPSMRYKSFTWTNNPSRCSYNCDRAIAKHKYPELQGVDIEDFDTEGVVITGTGEFFGPTAYQDWQRLNSVYREHGPGEFYHPIFTDVTKALMTKLTASLEPRENYVAYEFEITQHSEPPVAVKPVATISSTPTGSSSNNNYRVYIVVRGDCLWNIAKRFTGNPTNCWAIARYNHIKNPHWIYPGQRIVINM